MSKVSADVVFCDDIRQEVTGKFLLIGVYASDLVPGVIPSTFPMGMFVRLHGLPPGTHQFRLTVAFVEGATVFEQEGAADINTPDLPMVLIFSGFPVHVERHGILQVRLKVAGCDVVAGQLKVVAPPLVNT